MVTDTANELFANLRTALTDTRLRPDVRNRMLHEVLVLACAEGLKDSHYAFGDLNAQTERLIRHLHIPAAEANALRQARRDSNHAAPTDDTTLSYDVRALATFVSRVFRADIPGTLATLLPHDDFESEKARLCNEHIHVNTPDKRCIVKGWDENVIEAVIDEDGGQATRRVRYTDPTQYARMGYLFHILREGMHLNLLDCQAEGDELIPRLIIVEPDCLMDISVIASCFEDYGHHPLLYLLSRMKPRANSQAILLGNYAGSALDDIINDPNATPAKTLIRNFREKALEYVACTDFDPQQFKADAAAQAANIKGIVSELRCHYDLDKAILEPSFVCEKLGLQGRVDLMTTDLKLLVEQKSGRNIFIERNTNNGHGARVVEKHYVQVLLYYGILYYNFHVRHSDISLLYSKFPLPDGLVSVTNLLQLVYEALRFRNEAVALEFDIADNGLDNILPQLTEQTLNVAHMAGFFYDTYLRPSLLGLITPLHQLSPLERAYLSRMTRFAVRENLMSKVGAVEGTGNSVADLWHMPLAEKKETGNIYTGLQLLPTPSASIPTPPSSSSTLTFSIPDQGIDFLPNFRRNDMVYLYAYPTGEEPDVRKALLFKGSVSELHTDRISIKLADRQQNTDIYNHLPYDGHPLASASFSWCIEHASSDVGGSAGIRALYEFVTAPQHRKDLLLGQRMPRRDLSLTLSQPYNPGLDEMLLQAKQASDYYLLVGPPGTGKTSMALQFMVREALTEAKADILLSAYTNRAVDEICGMLDDNGIDYIRLGSELSCAPAYAPHLLANKVGERPTLDSMTRLLRDARIIVATTSTLQSRSVIFNVKHFRLAIVDEASQILEPNIIGLLASHRPSGETTQACNIDKFILIGDYKQLPAVVQQNDSDSAVTDPELRAIGLTDCRMSLFERLIHQEQQAGRTDFIGTLRRQGRMHPAIADFPNHAFYFAEHLEPVPLPHQRATSLGYTLPSADATDDLLKAHRLLFFASADCRQPEISDKVNADEARIVADLLRRIHRFYGKAFNADKTVGVIVPYRNQIAMIRKEIERLGLRGLDDISIDTVERYQGSQRDVIIYSFTIQRQYQLSFLTANTFEENGHLIDRKLNVALTRARKQLILTGNPHTLAANAVFSQLMGYIRSKGGYNG